jgi:Tol biopolymer transport system component
VPVEGPTPAHPDALEGLSPEEEGTYRLASDRDTDTYSPSFDAIGTAMFYHTDEKDRSPLVRAETGSDGTVLQVTRIVDDAANNFHVRPSPDGTRIAFDSDRDGVRGIYVADADGKNVRRVSGEGYASVPSWSPDGERLAFARAEADRPRVWNVWTLDLSNGEMRRITNRKYGQPWGGSWFPDGRRLAYSHEFRLFIHDLQTGEERVFETPRKGHLVRTPAVSPDGRRIVFQVHRDGTWLLELGTGAMRRILEDATAQEYTWAPDGRRVAYHSARSGTWGVWVMAPRSAR